MEYKTKAQINNYVRENAGILTPKEMGDFLGRPQKYIIDIGSRLKISLRSIEKKKKTKMLEDIIKERHSDLTYREISAMTGIKESTVKSKAWKLGFRLKPVREYINAEKPMVINTPIEWTPIDLTGPYFNSNQMDNWLVY